MRRGKLHIAFLLAALALPGISYAQDASGEGAVQKAKQLFNEGVDAFSAGDVEGGIQLLVQSYEMNPVPIVAYNLAVFELQAGKYVAAGNHLHQYLDTEANLTVERQQSVADVISNEIQPKASLVFVKGIEAGGKVVKIDGKPVGPSGIKKGWWVDPGEHAVTAAGYEPRTVVTAAGEVASIVLEPAAPPPPPPVTHDAGEDGDTKPAGKGNLKAGAGLAGAGGALIIAGIVMTIVGETSGADVKNSADGTPWVSVEDEYEKAKVLPVVGLVGISAGAALGIVGGVLLGKALARSKGSSERISLSPILPSSGDGLGIACSGKF